MRRTYDIRIYFVYFSDALLFILLLSIKKPSVCQIQRRWWQLPYAYERRNGFHRKDFLPFNFDGGAECRKNNVLDERWGPGSESIRVSHVPSATPVVPQSIFTRRGKIIYKHHHSNIIELQEWNSCLLLQCIHSRARVYSNLRSNVCNKRGDWDTVWQTERKFGKSSLTFGQFQ